MVAATEHVLRIPGKHNTLPQPPRLEGKAETDLPQLSRWNHQLYDQMVRRLNVLGMLTDMAAAAPLNAQNESDVPAWLTAMQASITELENQMTSRPLIDASVSLSTSSTDLLVANPKRRTLVLGNGHATQVVWVNLAGGTAAANGAGSIRMAAGDRLVWETNAPTNLITGISIGGSSPMTVQWS